MVKGAHYCKIYKVHSSVVFNHIIAVLKILMLENVKDLSVVKVN